jgi:hypothetical protein
MRTVCGNTATIDILHAALSSLKDFWRNTLKECRAVDYIYSDRYFKEIANAQLLQWHVDVRSPTQKVLFSKARLGFFSAWLPGFMCGSQPVESFHALWERVKKGLGGKETCRNLADNARSPRTLASKKGSSHPVSF